jgi:exodeoxyribonuclease VII large subunit
MDTETFPIERSTWGLGGSSLAALSVSDLTEHLAMLLRSDVILQDVWLRGEISNFTRAASGHLYFSLKDEGACVGCVMWRSSAGRLPFRPEPGMQVLAHGQIDVYQPRGQYQLIVDEIQPDGAGALHLALEQTKARLLAEGLLDASRKRPVPGFPSRVAVITSMSGAAVRDICAVLRSSVRPPEIVLVAAQVQGEAAERSLCEALELASTQSAADVIIIGRGGGSVEDLWSFNGEALARAIATCPVPVISAVGHETDFTLADLVADHRSPTPTAAAELLLDRREEWIRRYQQGALLARQLLVNRVEMSRLRLEAVQGRAPLAHPLWTIEKRRQELDDLDGRLARAREVCLNRWRYRLALAAGRLDGVSPLATLSRGYAAICRLPEEEPVGSARELREGDLVRLRFQDGSATARITQGGEETKRERQ